MIIKKETILAFVAIGLIILIGLLDYTPNILAYEYDDEFDYVTVEFDDTSSINTTEGAIYNITANQSTIVGFSSYSDVTSPFILNETPWVPFDIILCVIITDPSGFKYYVYGDADPIWTGDVIDGVEHWRGPMSATCNYNITKNGTYTIRCEQWFDFNGTIYKIDDYTFYLKNGLGSDESYDIFMGDWEWFELCMGFIGVVGFIVTPVFTAKLMSSKDPIVMIGVFLMCMITFGVLIYVFLLGGA